MPTREDVPTRQKPGRHRKRKPRHHRGMLVLGTATVAAALVGAAHAPAATIPDGTQALSADSPAGPRDAASGSVVADPSASQRAADLAVRRAEQARVSRARVDRIRKAAADRQRKVRAAKLAAQRLVWVKPVRSYHLTAGFDDAGGLWSSGHHTGQDFAAPVGTPVYAAYGGTIVFAGRDGAYGNKIEVRHDDGVVTWYAHLSKILHNTGRVAKGEEIGLVGSTGNTTGPHLHFEVHPHAKTAPGGHQGTPADAVDPMPWLRKHGVRV